MNLPPDGRLDGPVHEWFGLSYSTYQVLHRTLMQSMPLHWQERMVACLEELRDAFDHVDQPTSYIVTPAKQREYNDLSDSEMAALGVTTSARDDYEDDAPIVYYDRDGNEHDGWERVLVPVADDQIPHYNRGRTYVTPEGGS